MTTGDLESLQYPIGRFAPDSVSGPAQRRERIEVLRRFPSDLRDVLEGMGEAQISTPYRPGGWTVRQLIHHLADAHGTTFYRFKSVMTEDAPEVKTWEEVRWAETPDGRDAPIEPSLRILEGVHVRWVHLLESMGEADFARFYRHPINGDVTMDYLLQYMAWHCRHHLEHVRRAPAVAAGLGRNGGTG